VPRGTVTGVARRALKGVETFAIKSAADLDGAREFAAAHARVSKEDDMPPLKTAEPGTFSRITGIGAYRAENLATNDDIAGPINPSDEWIRQRTGIITRRRASEDVGVLDMCEEAALEAVASAGLKPEDIGGIIISTVTFPYFTPSAASALTDR